MMSNPSSEEYGNNTTNLMMKTPKSLQDMNTTTKKAKYSACGVKYMECLKNHAAAIGGNATDGCGEFMAGGEEGSLEALKCSACNCHRNFHRKINIQTNATAANESQPFNEAVVAKGYNNGAAELMMGLGGFHVDHEGGSNLTVQAKKRYRTKFSKEQKEKMFSFAEKAGWKIQKVGEAEVKSFCQEIGIKRKVLKVWMHNNKYHLPKKMITPSNDNNVA